MEPALEAARNPWENDGTGEDVNDWLQHLNEDGAEARALAHLAKARRELARLDDLPDPDAVKRRLAGLLAEAIVDPKALRVALPTPAIRAAFANEWRELAGWLERNAKRLATLVAFYETDPQRPGDPSGASFDVGSIVQAMKDKAAEIRKDADELEKL